MQLAADVGADEVETRIPRSSAPVFLIPQWEELTAYPFGNASAEYERTWWALEGVAGGGGGAEAKVRERAGTRR